MTRLGLAKATTKEIARAAGCSEALLYKHFREKEEIFLGVLKHRLPSLTATLAALPDQAGTGSVRERLVEVVDVGVRFYEGGLAIGSSMLGDPELVRRHREWMVSRGVGPQVANRMLADYLRAEQKAGRVATGVDARRQADLLVDCFDFGPVHLEPDDLPRRKTRRLAVLGPELGVLRQRDEDVLSKAFCAIDIIIRPGTRKLI